jgi:glycosyltransferase involved in cell wall biosynthesis
MVQKNKINLAFFFDSFGSWEGEKNYLNSLITAINKYNDRDVSVKIISSEKILKDIKKLNLQNIELINSSLFFNKSYLNLFRKFCSKLFKSYDPVLFYFIKKYNLNIISHYNQPSIFCKTICWLPDFQHIRLPQNFDQKEIIRRNNLYKNIIKNSSLILLSSKNSIKDLKKFSKKKNIRYKKLNFVPHIDFNLLNKDKIKRYNLKNYLIVPNQFWKHKNHLILVKAIKRLKDKKLKFKIVLTGDSKSQKDKTVFYKFISEIKIKKLDNFFLYLGKVSYSDLINLINQSNALINPSLFEGWSTSVEEAKILDKKILLSNIKVHKEQNPKKSYYFNPNDDLKLSKIIDKIINEKVLKKNLKLIKKNYNLNRAQFAKNYYKIVKYTYFN